MAVLTMNCPHTGCRPNPAPLSVERLRAQTATEHVIAFCLCPRCQRPVSAVLAPGAEIKVDRNWMLKMDAHLDHDLLRVSGWIVKDIFPAPVNRGVPEHTPEEIAKFYRQAKSSLFREENDAAGYLLRKVMERSLSILDGGASGSLAERLDALARAERLPRILLLWAKELTIIDGDPDAAGNHDVAAAAAFVETFLLSAFTTVARFELRASRAESPLLQAG